jgi:hypothetical protein
MIMIDRMQWPRLIRCAVSIAGISTQPAEADAISPHVSDRGRVYSNEPANSSFYGTGMSGRLSEASALRFEGEQDLHADNIDEAVRKLGKSVQLDPGFPPGHVLYARAITAKFYSKQDAIDEVLLHRCIDEWKLVWHHDADQFEQEEAKGQARKLMRIARALEKKKKEHAKALVAERKEFDAVRNDRKSNDLEELLDPKRNAQRDLPW